MPSDWCVEDCCAWEVTSSLLDTLIVDVTYLLNYSEAAHNGTVGNSEICPPCHLSTYRGRAFAYTGPTSWNSLPDNLKNVNLSLQLSNITLRHSSFPHTSTFSAFDVSYKNALYKFTVNEKQKLAVVAVMAYRGSGKVWLRTRDDTMNGQSHTSCWSSLLHSTPPHFWCRGSETPDTCRQTQWIPLQLTSGQCAFAQWLYVY